ncbi:MAG: tripartite tricarboxylate transporter substrate binding protein [Xanthobacteraceae bacterium]
MRKVIALAFTLLAAGTFAAYGQNYPSRAITIVVPYPAGGPTDTIARILAERMQVALSQSVIIENIGGAGGSIGVGHVAHASPDGYTLSIGHIRTHVFNAATLKLDYDVVKDFAPISLIADTPNWIVAGKSVPADDVKGLIAWLKATDGKATMGAVGIGSPSEFASRIFGKETGTSFQIVPYRGEAPLLQDMLGGHVAFAFGQAAGYLTAVENGQLKAFAVLQPKRWWAAPDVPTLDELGYKNIDVSFWHGLWAPKGTPPDVIAKLNAAVRIALADPTVHERFKKVGQEIWPVDYQTPEALAAKQQAELARWTPIIVESGIKAD